MIVKVCGMREPENIRAIEQAGADWMGFIFFPHSARYVTHCPEYLQRENREYLAESTGIRPALYPTAWQRDTGTMPQIKNRRIRNR